MTRKKRSAVAAMVISGMAGLLLSSVLCFVVLVWLGLQMPSEEGKFVVGLPGLDFAAVERSNVDAETTAVMMNLGPLFYVLLFSLPLLFTYLSWRKGTADATHTTGSR